MVSGAVPNHRKTLKANNGTSSSGERPDVGSAVTERNPHTRGGTCKLALFPLDDKFRKANQNGVQYLDEVQDLVQDDLVIANLTPIQAEWLQRMALKLYARRCPHPLQPAAYNDFVNSLENIRYDESKHKRIRVSAQSTKAHVTCRRSTAPRVVTKVTNFNPKRMTRTKMSTN